MRVFSEAHRTESDAGRELRREIFQRVDRDVDPTFQHRVVKLLGEERSTAKAGKRQLLNDVTGGPNLDPLRGIAKLGQSRPHPLGLPNGKRARASADPEWVKGGGHVLSVGESTNLSWQRDAGRLGASGVF